VITNSYRFKLSLASILLCIVLLVIDIKVLQLGWLSKISFSVILILGLFSSTGLYSKLKYERYIRFVLLNIPYILLFFIFPLDNRIFHLSATSLIFGAIGGILLIAINFQGFRLLLDSEYLLLLGKPTRESYILWHYMYISAFIFEELFYRGFIYSHLPLEMRIYSIPLGVLLFTGIHFLSDIYKRFSLKDYGNQIFLSLIGSIILVYTGSIWGSILCHLLFNLVQIISLNLRFYNTPNSD
jgi:membrane protease YdiL (CAAX protease family)